MPKKDHLKFLDTPRLNKDSSKFLFLLPKEMRKKAEIICINRSKPGSMISLSSFIRESILNNIRRYKNFIH